MFYVGEGSQSRVQDTPKEFWPGERPQGDVVNGVPPLVDALDDVGEAINLCTQESGFGEAGMCCILHVATCCGKLG